MAELGRGDDGAAAGASERNRGAGAVGGDDEVIAVYITFPNETSALQVARTLVERRLVACVNVMPGATSLFRWQGDVVREREVVAIAKTTRRSSASVAAAVQETHPYDLPCVVTYAAVGGSQEYLDWVRREVGAD